MFAVNRRTVLKRRANEIAGLRSENEAAQLR
jgi:hypothetical protein